MGLFIMVASLGPTLGQSVGGYLLQQLSWRAMTLLMMLQRGSFGMIFSASDTAIMRTLPAVDRTMGAGLHNMHRGIAMAFRVALGSVLLEKRLAFHALLTAHTRLAAYQDCSLVISIGLLAALVPAWWSRPRVLHMSLSLCQCLELRRSTARRSAVWTCRAEWDRVGASEVPWGEGREGQLRGRFTPERSPRQEGRADRPCQVDQGQRHRDKRA